MKLFDVWVSFFPLNLNNGLSDLSKHTQNTDAFIMVAPKCAIFMGNMIHIEVVICSIKCQPQQ